MMRHYDQQSGQATRWRTRLTPGEVWHHAPGEPANHAANGWGPPHEVRNMARITGPLLSLSASGKIADVLVASTWKGIPVMRQYVKPSNPRTTAQVAQRDIMTACVNAWRNTFTNTIMRTAWNRLALLLSDTMSGFNAYTRNATKAAVVHADSSFALSCTAIAGKFVEFVVKNLDDGATGDEAGNFEIWYGSNPDSLLLLQSVAIAAGKVTATSVLGATSDIRYVKIRKGSLDRSGIAQVTLLA